MEVLNQLKFKRRLSFNRPSSSQYRAIRCNKVFIPNKNNFDKV